MTELTLRATLSPSRIADFSSCPLKFRYRNVDRLPERPGPEAFRGSVVHKVLEDMFERPREERTEEFALKDLHRAFTQLLAATPEARYAIDASLAWPDDAAPAAPEAMEAFLSALPPFIARYFLLEDPSSFEATHRERYVRGRIDEDLWLHGFVDRIDVAPNGDVRIVDYKTGRSPSARFAQKSLFQLKCYALLWEDEHDARVRRLLMLFLGDGNRLVHDPTSREIEETRETVRGVWQEMKRANARAEWEARPSRLCDWCSYQQLCPAQSSHLPIFEPVPIEFPEQS